MAYLQRPFSLVINALLFRKCHQRSLAATGSSGNIYTCTIFRATPVDRGVNFAIDCSAVAVGLQQRGCRRSPHRAGITGLNPVPSTSNKAVKSSAYEKSKCVFTSKSSMNTPNYYSYISELVLLGFFQAALRCESHVTCRLIRWSAR